MYVLSSNALFFVVFQQSVAIELNRLRSQWKELCQKNIDIENACAKVEGDIMNLKKEAEEKWAV